MACDITLGRTEPCKDSVGGINAVYFVNFGDITGITYDGTSDVIDAVTGTPNAYKYEVRGNSTYTENIQSSRENGTTAFEQVLELTLKKLTKEDHNTIKLLSFGRPNILIEDNNGNVFLAGAEYGADVTGGTVVTGGAMADMSGYTLSFTGMEKAPANFLFAGADVASTISNAGFTVVS
ncbi:hypothetical protein N9D22_06625 [Flavobacteriaceae bacterium]|nr:hypothetical protein [Flavobacteriaceae bacterium]